MNQSENTYCYYSDLPSPMAYMNSEDSKPDLKLSEVDINRIIEMAWEDRTTFDAIKFQFEINESEVKALMKSQLKFSSYKLWRKRVETSKLKHTKKRLIQLTDLKVIYNAILLQIKFQNEIQNEEYVFICRCIKPYGY